MRQSLVMTDWQDPDAKGPFLGGAMVVATLGPQREKFWGVVLALTTEGLSISGTELASFEDFVSTVKEGAAYPTSVVFFPMHRIERIEMEPAGRQCTVAERPVCDQDRP